MHILGYATFTILLWASPVAAGTVAVLVYDAPSGALHYIVVPDDDSGILAIRPLPGEAMIFTNVSIMDNFMETGGAKVFAFLEAWTGKPARVMQ